MTLLQIRKSSLILIFFSYLPCLNLGIISSIVASVFFFFKVQCFKFPFQEPEGSSFMGSGHPTSVKEDTGLVPGKQEASQSWALQVHIQS